MSELFKPTSVNFNTLAEELFQLREQYRAVGLKVATAKNFQELTGFLTQQSQLREEISRMQKQLEPWVTPPTLGAQ